MECTGTYCSSVGTMRTRYIVHYIYIRIFKLGNAADWIGIDHTFPIACGTTCCHFSTPVLGHLDQFNDVSTSQVLTHLCINQALMKIKTLNTTFTT